MKHKPNICVLVLLQAALHTGDLHSNKSYACIHDALPMPICQARPCHHQQTEVQAGGRVAVLHPPYLARARCAVEPNNLARNPEVLHRQEQV